MESRNLKGLKGARHERRPSAVAKKCGVRRSTDVSQADSFEGNNNSWADARRMPAEKNASDVGPIDRSLPPFNGPLPGPTNSAITSTSTERSIMRELLTDEFEDKVHKFTCQRVGAYRQKHKEWEQMTGDMEHACGHREVDFLKLSKLGRQRFRELFDVWVAAKLRVAQVKPEMPAWAFWGKEPLAPALHDRVLDGVITYRQFQWCNRHMSFADAVDDASEGEDEGEASMDNEEGEDNCEEVEEGEEVAAGVNMQRAHDTFRKRRELTDLANKSFAAAYNPHQHCGLDEGTRSTKHWEKIRVRHKASVHSGTFVDMLNDCRIYYCMYAEEQTWRSKELEGQDVNSIERRLQRAAKCLVDKQKDRNGRSTANDCMSLDRGYGHVGAQHRLWVVDGVYTNAVMQANRIGLPRSFIAEVQKELQNFPRGCSHKPDDRNCRKFMWTVVHKQPFELCLWQDSKLILSNGNFFSGTRAGLLARGTYGDQKSYSVWAPEGI